MLSMSMDFGANEPEQTFGAKDIPVDVVDLDQKKHRNTVIESVEPEPMFGKI